MPRPDKIKVSFCKDHADGETGADGLQYALKIVIKPTFPQVLCHRHVYFRYDKPENAALFAGP
ncbi:MAG: hypothetical protein HN877_18415 [Rhodospirillaceae bacterium]|jgi:hypothetical protein|nr:hypothetical protein [Rhodospirillaceae bacterium]